MDAERWDAVQRVFLEAVAMPPEARAAFLDATCGADADLRQSVDAMLAADGVVSLLDSPTGDVASALLTGERPTAPVGTSLGAYRLTALLGAGGSGVVYLAEREDLGNVVAVKVLRDSWVSPSRRERFVSEQRTLAKLTHPCIARIVDAGIDDGTLWFAMEHVDGLPLDAHCQRSVPDLAGRLRLVARVCDAVQYAHERLVVHRDLKPSNVLVQADGTPKLLDFGIALRLGPPGQADPSTPLRFLTPGYAAPEELGGQPVGVQADVYSLGALLRELVTTAPGGAGSGARRADLEALCARAVEADPARRYHTVDAMRRDLDAFLRGFPVSVRPATMAYRAQRFLGRHRRAAAAVATFAVVLGGVTGYYGLRLSAARAETGLALARSERLLHFVLGLFEGGIDGGAPAADLRVVSLLERGVGEASRLTTDPEAQAEVRETLGGIYAQLGDFEQADRLLQQALETRASRLDPAAPDVVRALLAVAALRQSQARLDEAQRLAADAHDRIARRDPAHPLAARAVVVLGRVQRDKGEYDASIRSFGDAIRRFERQDGADADLADALGGQAESQYYLGQYDLAAATNRRAGQVIRRVRGPKHPDVAHQLLTAAAIASAQRRHADAETADREALQIFTDWFGDGHPETASAKTILAQALGAQGRHAEAIPLLRDALAVQDRVYGPRHPRTAFVQNELGMAAFQTLDYETAAPAFQRAIDGYHGVNGRHFQEGVSLANLGSVRLAQGQPGPAEAAFREALHIYAGVLPADHLNVAVARAKLGRALLRQHRPTEARPELEAALPVLEKQPGGPSTWLVATREDLTAIGRAADR